MKKSSLYELLSVVGGILILFSWILQQSIIEDSNKKLDHIKLAESIFYEFYSNNAIFNALALSNNNQEIRSFQNWNYGLGLQMLSDQTDMHYEPTHTSSFTEFHKDIKPILEKAKTLREDIERKLSLYMVVFNLLYAAGTIMALMSPIRKCFLIEIPTCRFVSKD